MQRATSTVESSGRHDELGELAEAFNGMARACAGSQMALQRGASHDSVTGLANRASLIERLEESFGAAATAGPARRACSPSTSTISRTSTTP